MKVKAKDKVKEDTGVKDKWKTRTDKGGKGGAGN